MFSGYQAPLGIGKSGSDSVKTQLKSSASGLAIDASEAEPHATLNDGGIWK